MQDFLQRNYDKEVEAALDQVEKDERSYIQRIKYPIDAEWPSLYIFVANDSPKVSQKLRGET